MLASSASSLMGSTMPLVPKTEMPPSMPRRGLKVFFASSTPAGMETTTFMPGASPLSSSTAATACRIICIGTGLIALSPIFCLSPGLVTRPTPIPPSTVTPGVRCQLTSA